MITLFLFGPRVAIAEHNYECNIFSKLDKYLYTHEATSLAPLLASVPYPVKYAALVYTQLCTIKLQVHN